VDIGSCSLGKVEAFRDKVVEHLAGLLIEFESIFIDLEWVFFRGSFRGLVVSTVLFEDADYVFHEL
jgi:hypothetical protein